MYSVGLYTFYFGVFIGEGVFRYIVCCVVLEVGCFYGLYYGL